MRLFMTQQPARESLIPTVSELRIEVQREVQGLLALVDRQAPQRATEAETALWAGVLRLGVAMMTLFFAHQAARWPTGLRYEVNGIHHEVEGADTVEIGTKFGKVSVLQPMGRRVDRPRSRRDMPMARVLGLPGGFTLPLVALVAKFCALMAFSPTRQILRDLLGWAPAPRSVLRMVDTVGAEARGFLEQAAMPEGDTDVLLITVDGKGAPTMHQATAFRFAVVDGTKLLELPYQGGALAMTLVLPDPVDGLAAMEARLSQTTLDTWLGALAGDYVDVKLPKLEIDPAGSLSLKETLQALGMPFAFLATKADFTGIGHQRVNGSQLYIDQVFHKALRQA